MADNEDAGGRPYHMNASGHFYVVAECCTSCGVPVSEAPDLFAYDDRNHCHFKRQPTTRDEIDRALRAAWAAELECIRYGGTDADIRRRFAEFGSPHLCDVPPPSDIRPLVRDRVTFDTDSYDHARLSALDLARSYHDYVFDLGRLRQGDDESSRYRIWPVKGDAVAASLTYSSVEDSRHTVEFRVDDSTRGRWQVLHLSADRAGGRAVSLQIADWLEGIGFFCRVRWRSAEECAPGVPGQETPL
jgi:ferredoxin